jgi:hypothetical protein
MSPTSRCSRHGAQSENLITEAACWHPLGCNVIAFQAIKAPSRPQRVHDPRSAGATAEIVPLNLRHRSHLAKPAPRGWSDESANEKNSGTRDEYSQRMRENILAIGWVGTLMALTYCMLTVPMH